MDERAEREAQQRMAEQIRRENEAWRRDAAAAKEQETQGMTPQERLLWELGLSREEVLAARK